MSIKSKVEDLNNMILQGQILEAFDKYYADDVVMQDNETDPRVGKPANREYEEQFVNALQEFHGAEIKNVAINEDEGTSMVEWFMDMSFKNGHREKRNQVAIQQWKDGQIVNEHFIYNQN